MRRPRMRSACLILFYSCLSAFLLSCRPASNADEAGTQSVKGTAQVKFRASVAKAYGVDEKTITVRAQDLGIPQADFTSRSLSEIFAFRADFKNRDVTVYGCNTAAPGDPAFIKHPDGLTALMKAARVLDEAESLPIVDVVALSAWIYHDLGSASEPQQTTMQRADGRLVFTYIARTTGLPSAGRSTKVTVTIQSDYSTKVTSEAID